MGIFSFEMRTNFDKIYQIQLKLELMNGKKVNFNPNIVREKPKLHNTRLKHSFHRY